MTSDHDEAPSRARWKSPRDDYYDYSRSYLQCLADTAPKQKACSRFEAGVGGWCKHNYGGESDACTWRVAPT